MQHRINFGTFIAPYHRLGDNPLLSMRRDLDLIQRCDELGFHEAWVGEHHSAAWENIASTYTTTDATSATLDRYCGLIDGLSGGAGVRSRERCASGRLWRWFVLGLGRGCGRGV